VPEIDFCPCRADGSMFPRARWLRSMTRALGRRGLRLHQRPGAPALRDALAAYLNRVRGTSARPERHRDLQRLRAGDRADRQVLAAAERARLAVEDPSADDDAVPVAAPPASRSSACRSARRRPSDALDGRRRRARAHAVAPVADRRGALAPSAARRARWARERDALIVEDDYDAEYRYDRAPIGALQGLAPDRVVYAGTASKTLAPGLRLGWLVVPPRLVDASPRPRRSPTAARRARPARVRRLPRPRRVRPPPAPHAAALPAPPRRAARRARRAPAELEPAGIAAGLHLVAYLPPASTRRGRARRAARRRGLRAGALPPPTPAGPA
jgi:GntR family transcriptional regulator/MocR family aminotransferase